MTAKKLIQFNRAVDNATFTDNGPAPAVKFLPAWYRKMAKHIGGKVGVDVFDRVDLPLSIKACPPFLDSMMSGYIIAAEYDLLVSYENDVPVFRWKAGGELVHPHDARQIVPEQIPEGYSSSPLKFINPYQIITPRGYSTLFVHPLNRAELPFYTLSGIVETDVYKIPVNFPFLIKEGWQGVIPAGTPLVQLIPIKREIWISKLAKADLDELGKLVNTLNHRISGVYKALWWKRKEYR